MNRDLVERAQRWDREAFAVLVHQVSDSLYAVAWRILRDTAYDPAVGELHVLQGDSLISIQAMGRPLGDRLTVGSAVAEIALERL